jgi:sigma-E factor negative regulatory protein RseC
VSDVIEQNARVVGVADGSALVEVPRQSGCSSCGLDGSCGTSVVAKLFGSGNATRLRVRDRLGVAPGDEVVIGIRSPLLVRASLIAYLLPLLVLIGASSAADAAGLGDTGAAAVGITGLAAGLWLTGLITGGTGPRARFRPIMLRRVELTTPVRFEAVHPAVGG